MIQVKALKNNIFILFDKIYFFLFATKIYLDSALDFALIKVNYWFLQPILCRSSKSGSRLSSLSVYSL